MGDHFLKNLVNKWDTFLFYMYMQVHKANVSVLGELDILFNFMEKKVEISVEFQKQHGEHGNILGQKR